MIYRTKAQQSEPSLPAKPPADRARSARSWALAAVAVSLLNLSVQTSLMIWRHYEPNHWFFTKEVFP